MHHHEWVTLSKFLFFFLLISLHYIIICQYYIPKWNRMILKNLEKNFFPRVPPLKIVQNFEKCQFSMHFVVSSSFEIQTSPICQIEWFYILILNLDGD